MTATPSGSPGPEFDPPATYVPGPSTGLPGQPSNIPVDGSRPAQAPGLPGQPWNPPVDGSVPSQAPATGYSVPPQFPAAGHSTQPQFPAPGIDAGYPMQPGLDPSPAPVVPERVGPGLGAAALVLVASCALTAGIYHFGFIASVTAWLMAFGAAWAYTKVAGPPVKGRVPLLVLIIVAVVLGFLSMVASAVWDYYWQEVGSAGTNGEAVQLVFGNLFNLALWQDLGTDAVLYFVFAALGAFGVVRRMATAGRQAS